MQSYDQILNTLTENNVKPLRWYTIDNFIYLFYGTYVKQANEKVSKLFSEVDHFDTYNGCICIDMDKQPNINGEPEVKRTFTREEIRARRKQAREKDMLFDL